MKKNGLNNMAMVWLLLIRDLSHNPMRNLKCSGSSFLLLLWSALATYLLNLVRKLTQASGEGRGRSRCALPLLSLLLFSSFSFASSSISYCSQYLADNDTVGSSPSSACQNLASAFGDPFVSANSSTCYLDVPGNPDDSFPISCSLYSSLSCSPSSSDTVVSASTWSEYFSNASYCDPSSDCVTSGVVTNGSEGVVTNGSACSPNTLPPASPTTSTSSTPSTAATPCPPGYSIYDSSGCVCSNGSGSFISINSADTTPSCNGGYSTAPTLSPVAPDFSNGVESCPSGSASISNSSGDISCYSISIPPKVSSASSGSVSNDGGSGGSSSFHDVPPVTNSSGQTVCPSGSSSISGANGSGLTCVASGSSSGSGSAPTSSGTSATSSTGSATAPTSSTNYPSSVSMPTLASSSVVSTALGTIGNINETSSETCPSPITFSLMNTTFSIPFTYACSLAADVRPIVIGVFSLASILLIVK